MSKIVINKNLAKYFYRFVDNVFKPLTANTTVTGYSAPTTGTTGLISALREVVITKQSTLATLDKISTYYRNLIYSNESFGWFRQDVNTINRYTTNTTNTFDFGKSATIYSLTTTTAYSRSTSPFKIFVSDDNVNWVESYVSSATLTTEVKHIINKSGRYIKLTTDGSVCVPYTKAFEVYGYSSTGNIIDWTIDLSVIITGILTQSTRATTLATLVSKNIITQAESDAMLLINLTDRPIVTSTITDDVVTFNMTNPNKLVRRYIKDIDNSTETMYLLFPYYTNNSFNGALHYGSTVYSYNTVSSELSKQVLSYIAISLGTTGTEDIVLDYDANIDCIDDMSFKIKLPTTIIV